MFCISIEVDEGFIIGIYFRNNFFYVGVEVSECIVFVVVEEGGVVVIEGFVESEIFFISIKEGESGECVVVEFEDRVVDLLVVYVVKIEVNVNSVVIEEKDDVVISVGFEEKCDGFLSRDLEIVEGIIIFISEVESDGVVISVGIEIRVGFISSEEVDGF